MTTLYKKCLIFLALVTLSFSLLAAPTLVAAQDLGNEGSSLSNFKKLDQQILNDVNPLQQYGDATLTTPGAVISKFMTYFAFPIAGFILFVMIVVGGFEILAGSATKKSLDSGKQRITNALVGFLLLFISYWIVQVIQTAFGIQVL
jgi:hypothetical protein